MLPDAPASPPSRTALPRPAWRWPAAVALAASSMALRAALEPWLQGSVPFVFAFPAVVIVALLAGAGPALLAIAVCLAWAGSPDLPPYIDDKQLPLFALSAGVAVFACRWAMRPAAPARAQAQAVDGEPADHGMDVEQWLRLLIALALLLPTAFFAVTGWQAYTDTLARARERAARGALLASEQALKVMRTADLLLQRTEDELAGLSDDDIRVQAPQLLERLRRPLPSVPEVDAVVVWDRHGRGLLHTAAPPAAAAKADISARPDFRAHAAGTTEGVVVSAPQPGLFQPEVLRIVVTRRRSAADGSFDGVLAVALKAPLFQDFYRDLTRAEPGASVSLFRPDGTVIVRYPAPAAARTVTAPASGAMMQRVRAGDTEGLVDIVSPIDQQRRIAAFRRLPGYPLYVASTISEAAVLAGWRSQLALLAAFTFPPSIALAWVSWVALKRTQRERQAMQRWRAETAKRAQVEEALRQTQRLEALGHLTGGVAHDVNNLLMVVSNNAYLLKRLLAKQAAAGQATQAMPMVDKPVDAILRAVATGARLTRQLLAFARRQALRPEVVSLQERLPLLLELMRHSVSARVEVDGQVAADTPPIEVDPAELELAMINLAVNARDAMPEGGRLRVQARPARADELEAGGVSLEVADTGVGIPAEHLARVFEPFYTTKEPGKGTGLGLSQVHGLCQQAGGVVRIHSVPGQGTRVQLLLPAARSRGAQLEDAGPATVPAAQGKLLLVEDNAEVAAATEPLLASWGYHVTHLRSADEAQAMLAHGDGGYDLLLSDIVMPGTLNGVALARQVRQRHPRMGIVLTTGYASETGKAMAEGFIVLQKPWSPQQLAAVLQQAAGHEA